MKPEFLCHLPFLRLPAETNQPLAAGGRLTPLEFADWLLLEDPAMDYHEGRYRKVAPVFVVAPLPEGERVGELTEAQERASEEIVERAQTAAILAMPATAIAPPSMSVSYVAWRGLPCDPPGENRWFGPPERDAEPLADDEGIQLGRIAVWLQQTPPGKGAKEQWVVERRFGPAQREWLLSGYAAEADAMTPEHLEAFVLHYGRLERAGWGPRRAAAVRCADVLTAMTTEGTPLHEVVVLFVAALENLVNAAADRPLGDTFARRCAAWFAETPDEWLRDQPRFRQLYAARSDILHGGDPQDAVQALMTAVAAASERDLHIWMRLHVWLAVDGLVGWYGGHSEDDGGATRFQAALAEAAACPPDQWLLKRAKILEGRSHVRG